jgi:DNA-binding transcriptional LysR family regulator
MLMHIMHDRCLAALDLNLLVVLRALLAERHVTRAALRVGLSQSATSHALARLRDLYADPLLVRRGRTLELTPRAARLLPALERGLGGLLDAVASEPAFDPRTARRTFNLGMADYLQALTIGPLLRQVARDAPGVDLSVVVFPNVQELVESGAVDLALMVPESITRTLSHEPLFSESFLVMVRRDHPEIGRTLTQAQYLRQRHVVVAPRGTPGSTVDDALAQRGLTRRVALRVTNFLIAPVVVCQTDFLSTMPERLARQLAQTYPVRLLRPPVKLPTTPYGMYWHPRLDHDPAQKWLRAQVARSSRAR